jgi:ribosomal protein S16
VKCDSKTALASMSNPVISARNKHIEIKHHFIRDLISEGAPLFEYVQSVVKKGRRHAWLKVLNSATYAFAM